MRKKVSLVCLFLLFLTPVWCATGGVEYKRTISRQFEASRGDKLEIDNRYGNIVLKLWERDEIDFSIEITGKGDRAEQAQELAERVSVDFNQNGNSVSARTVFAPVKYNSCRYCSTSVHYTVHLPADLYLDLTNKYGDIYLEEATMPFRAELKYGDLKAGSLLSGDNRIDLKYGNASLRETQGLVLDVAYSKVTIGKAAVLKLASAYSEFKSEEVGTWNLSSKYDHLSVDRVGRLSCSSAYSDFHLKYLATACTIDDIRYGKVRIEEVARDFSSIDISAAYTNIRLGIDGQSCFRAELSTRYGNIQTGDLLLQEVRMGDEKQRKSLTALVGPDKNPGASVRVSNSYADIILR